jgi:GNAT superfamily N-acetyltransferase
MATSGLVIVTADTHPDLWDEALHTFDDVWPEYNLRGDVSGQYFNALVPRFARFQLLVWDTDAERIIARGRTIPFTWDGTLEDLPRGIDALGLRALEETRPANALSALSAEVAPDQQRRGISRIVLRAMADLARADGFNSLVAPVRPNWKDRHPLVPIDEYVTWRNDDGLPLDPWMRVHARMGATVLRTEPDSLRITAPVADWERWTGTAFTADGDHVFPGGLAPLAVRDGIGRYWEPNVWMLHRIGSR